jgi:hypothetical protein
MEYPEEYDQEYDEEYEYADEETDEDPIEADHQADLEEATGPCPECAAPLALEAEVCYACGYWLTTAERHTLWEGGSQLKSAARVGKQVLIAILILTLSGIYIFLV